MKRLLILCLILLGLNAITATAAHSTTTNGETPRLVINIVVGSMRSGDLDRYAANLTENGFRRIMREGITYTEAYYNFSSLSTASGLATLTTGANPSVHGVIGERWWSHTDASAVWLINDNKSFPVEFSTGSGNHSAHRLTSPTYGDMLLNTSREAKLYTVALEPLSAIVLNGKQGVALWTEQNQTYWTTSSAYCSKLAQWIIDYNKADKNKNYTENRWQTLYKAATYRNSEVAVVEGIKDKSTQLITNINLNLTKTLYDKLLYTPAGNTATLRFAEELMRRESLGSDSTPDVLNIYLDASRNIAQTYGPESIEYEDMLYRLDKDMIAFLDAVYKHVGRASDVVIVVTSDHGTSPSYNATTVAPRHRFNHRQMEVIVNAYLGARYGSDNYVAGYANKNLYLNHATIANKKLALGDICDEVATFLLQLQGISTAISSTSMRNSSFDHGRTLLMQECYFGARSGDVIIDLVPGTIIEDDDYRSLPSGGYIYDRHVPLIISCGRGDNRRVMRTVEITELAPTLCHLMGIEAPWASSTRPLAEFK